ERYLHALGDLSENVARYNNLSNPDSADTRKLVKLVSYLYGRELPTHSASGWEFYTAAMRSASAPRVTDDRTQRALDRSDLLMRASYDGLFERLDALRVRAASASYAADGTRNFGSIRDEIAGVRGFFDDSESYWLDPRAAVGTRVRGALDSLPRTRFVDADAFRRGFLDRFRSLRYEKLRQIGEGLEPYSGGVGLASYSTDPAATPGTVLALRAALDSLQRQSFAEQGDPVRVRAAIPAGTRLVWDPRMLDLALAKVRDYDRFVGHAFPGLTPGAQTLVQGLAAAELEAGVTRAVAGAMRQAPVRNAFGQRGADRDLRERVAEFGQASDRLVQVVGALDRLGLDQARDDLAGVVLAQAAGMLADADRLLAGSGSYLPADGFDAWDGSGSPALAAYGAGTPDELEAYLAAQQQRVRALFDGLAAPLLGAVTAAPLAPAAEALGYAASPVVARWRTIDAALDGYDAKAPGNTLAALENFIRVDLRDGGGTCARGRAPRAADYFGEQLARVRSAFQARCRGLAGAGAVAGYDRIQDAFQEDLAGRFPFAPASAGGSEADPEAIRAFFRLMDDNESAWRQVVGGGAGVGGPGSPQALFLEQLVRARAFLAPVLAGDSAAGPTYVVGAEFRVNRAREAGGDQIAAWTLDVGTTRLEPRGADSTAAWSPGDPVRVFLRWATESPVTPAPGPGARVSGRTATWVYGGGWALLRLLRQQAALPGEGGTERGRSTLRFALPTQPSGEARVFLRLRLLNPKTGAEVAFPTFPTSAPTLRATRPSRQRAAPAQDALQTAALAPAPRDRR
ncbi:MAG: hypothetical protein JO040_04305, partial [Gemmatimonadetes bacterium]|nr:hypothetical protein [Gemmatimonadota bacterium]